MSFLFYLNQQNSDTGLKNFERFINCVVNSIDEQIVILCESTFDKEGLESLLVSPKIKEIIYVYESLNNYTVLSNNGAKVSQYDFLNFVEPNIFDRGWFDALNFLHTYID